MPDPEDPVPMPGPKAIAEFAHVMAAARRRRDSLPIEQAVDEAYTVTGPSRDELRERIAALRQPDG